MQDANLGFLDAVEQLAREAGLEMPRQSPEEREKSQYQATIQGAVEAACRYFEETLHDVEGRDARLYLERRGLDLATIRRFRLGYATERSDALKRALEKTFSEPLLIEAGVLRPRDGGGSYDYFRNRVIFPIGDRQGRIIAFGGRVLGEGQPKYLNSPETPLFHKGSVLYGWAAARAAAARAPSAIVTEGYMDVIALHRAGFETAVAPLGTALTETQIEALLAARARAGALLRRQRLDARVRAIADRTVQEEYRGFFRERFFAVFGGRRGKGPVGRRVGARRSPEWMRARLGLPERPPAADPALLLRRKAEVMLAAYLNHPLVLHDSVADELAELQLKDPLLDKLPATKSSDFITP